MIKHLVVGHCTLVATPLCIEGDGGILAFLGTLRGNQNNTVTTTCSIKGCRGSILQHRHRLNVNRVDIVQRAIVR